MKKILLTLLIIPALLTAQEITWTEITSDYTLPAGIKIFKGTRPAPELNAWYIEADLNNPDIAVRPYIGTSKTVPAFTGETGAYAAVNGGFFGGGVSYSAVVYPNEVKAQNVGAVTRDNKSYPVMRSLFSMKSDRSFAVDWIYHFGNGVSNIYTYETPMPYAENDPTPLPTPQSSAGTQYEDILVGIGGGPTLVKAGAENVTYNEEIFWGSGVGLTNGDPRTAVGYTADNKVILFVADGRQTVSDGVSLVELAEIMISLGCVEAMNLDGGGSSQMAVGNQYVNNPNENRLVPSILAVVHSDSLKLHTEPLFEKIIDTGDEEADTVGSGWFETANAGFWGDTKSLLNGLGDGSKYVQFNLSLPAEAKYQIYGWWVASSNRCQNTPFIIQHKNGTDTVRIDQTLDGSTWKYIGEYQFDGSTDEKVLISDAGSLGSYVVADAIRITSFDPVTSVEEEEVLTVEDYVLSQNYPNPFNPETTIKFSLKEAGLTRLSVFNILGEEVKILANQFLPVGVHQIKFNAAELPSGIYIYHIKVNDYSAAKKLVLLK